MECVPYLSKKIFRSVYSSFFFDLLYGIRSISCFYHMANKHICQQFWIRNSIQISIPCIYIIFSFVFCALCIFLFDIFLTLIFCSCKKTQNQNSGFCAFLLLSVNSLFIILFVSYWHCCQIYLCYFYISPVISTG